MPFLNFIKEIFNDLNYFKESNVLYNMLIILIRSLNDKK
jgi:hypothetical protein